MATHKTSLPTGSSREIDNLIDKSLDKGMNKIVELRRQELIDVFMTEHSINGDNFSNQIKNNIQEQLKSGTNKIEKMNLRKGVTGVVRGPINVRDYGDVYDRYNAIIFNKDISEPDKKIQLKMLDTELAARYILDDVLVSSTHTFKRRINFKDEVTRNQIYDIVKVFYGENKIEKTQKDLSQGTYFYIKRKDEIGDVENSSKKAEEEAKEVDDGVKKIGKDVKEIGEDVEKIGKDVKEIGEDVKKIGEDVKKIGEDVKEIGEDVKKIGEDVKEVKADVKKIGEDVKEIKEDVKKIGEDVEEIKEIKETRKDIEKHIGIEEERIPTGTLDDELDVNFSDMKQSMKDIADERAYNEDSREYVEALRNKNTKFGKMLVAAKQAMLGDFFRMRKYKKELKDMDGKKTGLNVRGDWANVAKVHGGQGLNAVMELTQTSHPVIYDKISKLASDYYSGGSTMTDITFEKELKQIFESRDAEPLVEELKSKGVSIDKSASDILQSLQIQKEQNTLTYQVSKAVSDALGSRSVLPAPEADTLANNIATLFKNFTATNRLVPQLFTHYNKLNPGNEINLNDTYENISKQLVAHLDSLTMVAAQSMTNRVKLNIKFLADGHSVDHIEAKKGEKQSRWNPAAKLGNIMYGKGYKWRRFPTKALATGGTAALGTLLLGPLGGIVAGSIVAGSLAAGKKSAQTQRKKHSIEKEYIKDRDNKTNMMNQEDLMKLKYLDDIGNYNEIKTEVERILSQPVISNTDQDNLVGLLSRIMAGLKYQEESGHNAFSLKKRVSTSRPEADEITREKNYNEAMSDLYKLKELSLKRLQLQDVNLTEEDIRNEDQYDSYLSGYKGDFKKFLKLFKKERRKEMRKTGGRTAAIYGAVGGITLGLSHFLDRVGGDSDVDVGDIDTGDANIDTGITAPNGPIDNLGTSDALYNLGDFDASPDFSQDISDQLASMPNGTNTIKVDYFAGVDGTPANASSFTMDMIEDKAGEIENILDSGNFSQDTINNVKQVLSDGNIKELIKFAQTNGADAGNQNLFTLRNLEGIQELLKQVDGKSDIDLKFDFSDSSSIIGNTAYVPQDRMSGINLEAIIGKTPPSTPDTPDVIIPNPTSSGTSWRGGQGVYTEDNTHKGQDNI